MASGREERIHPMIVAVAVHAIRLLDPSDAPAGLPGVQAVLRSEKLKLLDRLNQLGGSKAVLEAGQVLKTSANAPMLAVLRNSDSVAVLVQKLTDFNRYFHAQQRHAVVVQTRRSLVLDHIGLDGEPPLPIESLFTCGFYIALLEDIGCRDLVCHLSGGGRTALAYRDGVARPVDLTACGRWEFGWSEFNPRRPLPGIEAIDVPPDLAGGTLSERIHAVLSADLARKWRVADVAQRLGFSGRSLQRHLGSEGYRFSHLLTQARIDAARTMLRDSEQPIATIGYVCGFADTAHFTRSFKTATALTPSAWRAATAGSCV